MAEETRNTELENAPAPQGAGELGNAASRVAGDLRDEAEARTDRWIRDLGGGESDWPAPILRRPGGGRPGQNRKALAPKRSLDVKAASLMYKTLDHEGE